MTAGFEVKPRDVVCLRKEHPCGSSEWQVVRLGSEVGLRCLKCQRYLILKRRVFEQRLKDFISRGI
ncbi:MAG: DUF951 domain-containing protein [Dehalococcoidales bacterium]|nr:DUF951 domain-containing protein [Dehalococcoidales bacterium]